jgi:hypothetical protein
MLVWPVQGRFNLQRLLSFKGIRRQSLSTRRLAGAVIAENPRGVYTSLFKEVPIMRKQWLATAVGLSLAIGVVIGRGLLTQAGDDKVVIEAGWRYSDGSWNYWDPDDRAWYYTDGKRWYVYDDDDAWTVYKFDRKFGKKAFREGYVIAKPGPDVVVPRHKIKVKVKD